MKFRKNVIKSVLIRWFIVILALIIMLSVLLLRARPIIISYAQSHAKSVMINAFNDAVKHAITSLDYGYGDMAVITRTKENLVTSIEIDYQKLNILRAEISNQISKYSILNSDNTLNIPIGTLLGSEYTSGYGPAVKIKLRFSQMPILDFKSNFTSAGINMVLHQIIITADLSCSIVMLGADKAFSVKMTAIAAQTVISGAVPDNFTNVIETPNSNIADDIFNYSNN